MSIVCTKIYFMGEVQKIPTCFLPKFIIGQYSVKLLAESGSLMVSWWLWGWNRGLCIASDFVFHWSLYKSKSPVYEKRGPGYTLQWTCLVWAGHWGSLFWNRCTTPVSVKIFKAWNELKTLIISRLNLVFLTRKSMVSLLRPFLLRLLPLFPIYPQTKTIFQLLPKYLKQNESSQQESESERHLTWVKTTFQLLSERKEMQIVSLSRIFLLFPIHHSSSNVG